jgi:hypothetical protein
VLGCVQVGRDLDRTVRSPRVERTLVVWGNHGNRLDAEPSAGAKHPNGDLPAVRDE